MVTFVPQLKDAFVLTGKAVQTAPHGSGVALQNQQPHVYLLQALIHARSSSRITAASTGFPGPPPPGIPSPPVPFNVSYKLSCSRCSVLSRRTISGIS